MARIPRVLLGGLTDDQVRRLVGTDLPQYTPATLSTTAELIAALDEVRRDGFSVAVDELEVGLTAVAAPVRSLHGDIVASVSVSGPSFRLAVEGTDTVIDAVRAAGAQVSARMGWRNP